MFSTHVPRIASAKSSHCIKTLGPPEYRLFLQYSLFPSSDRRRHTNYTELRRPHDWLIPWKEADRRAIAHFYRTESI